MQSKTKSQNVRENALYYSNKNEELPSPFIKLIEKQNQRLEKKWNKYENPNFSTPQCKYSSQTKKPIFSTPNEYQSPKRLLFPTTPSRLLITPQQIEQSQQESNKIIENEIKQNDQEITPLDFSYHYADKNESNIQMKYEIIEQNQQPEIVSNQQSPLIEINNEQQNNNDPYIENFQYQIENFPDQEGSQEEELNKINEEIKLFISTQYKKISEIINLKNVHTQQFIKLLYQCYEINNQILESKERQKIVMKSKILQDLIAYFASVLPQLESQIIKEIVSASLELSNRKIILCQ